MDIAIIKKTRADGSFFYDIALEDDGPNLQSDEGLDTAITLSLLLDRRVNDDDLPPDGTADRRGWWGDVHATVPGDLYGSRWWLLTRVKLLPDTPRKVRDYAEEALQWLLDDGVCSSIEYTLEIPRPGVIGLTIDYFRPDGRTGQIKFANIWEAIENGI